MDLDEVYCLVNVELATFIIKDQTLSIGVITFTRQSNQYKSQLEQPNHQTLAVTYIGKLIATNIGSYQH